VEIITGVERRRRWLLDEKLRFVAEAEAAGPGFVEIARRHDVSCGLLWHWRRQVPSCELRSVVTTSFLPVQVIPDAGVATPASVAVPASTHPQAQAGADETIDITLSDGTTVRALRPSPSACPCCGGRLNKFGEEFIEMLERGASAVEGDPGGA
jgi:transposase